MKERKSNCLYIFNRDKYTSAARAIEKRDVVVYDINDVKADLEFLEEVLSMFNEAIRITDEDCKLLTVSQYLKRQ